jgi:putative membrane protein
MGFGWLVMILFWGGLIALGVLLVRALFPHANQPPPVGHEQSAREILERRFARGEIGAEEYDVIRQAISDEQVTPPPSNA